MPDLIEPNCTVAVGINRRISHFPYYALAELFLILHFLDGDKHNNTSG